MKLSTQIRKLPKSVKLAIIVLVLLVIYLCVAKIDIVSPGMGVITGSEDKIDIISPGSGFINKFDLKTGSVVRRGDILFSYTNLDSFYKEKSLRDLVEFSKQRITDLETDLRLLNVLKTYEFSAFGLQNTDMVNVPVGSGTAENNSDEATTIKNKETESKVTESEKIENQTDSDKTDHSSANSDNQNNIDKNNVIHNENDIIANTTNVTDKVNSITSDTLKTKNTVSIANITSSKTVTTDASEAQILQQMDQLFASTLQSNSVSAFKYYQEYKSLIAEKLNLRQRKNEINKGIDELSNQMAMLSRKATLLRNSGAPQVDIINAGSDISKTRSQIIQEKISLLSLENDMQRARQDFDSRLLSNIYDSEQQLARLRKEQIENVGELALLKGKIRSNSVEAPVDGVVLDIMKNFTEGSYVEQSQQIMKLKKNLVRKVVEARFDAKYRPFIFDNGEVKVVINTPGYKKYYTGHITKISADSFTDEEKRSLARYYKVEIIVDDEGFNENKDSEGIQVSVFAISKKMTVINYLTALVNSNIVFNVW